VCAPPKKLKEMQKGSMEMQEGLDLYLLGPSGSLFRPLKLPESTLLQRGVFGFLVNSQFAMVIMSCQLLFIDFFGPFCHFLNPFVIFSGLKII
jgi:hypothetical protein